MWKQLKSDFQRHPKRFTLIFAGMAICALVVIWQVRQSLPVLWPSRARLTVEREAVAKAHRELQVGIDRACELIRNQESLLGRAQEFWLVARDGNAELEIQKIVGAAAKSAGLDLNSVGNVQSEKIGEVGERMYLGISAQAPFRAIVEFMAELEKCQPRFYWRNLTLRPDNLRSYANVVFNGNLEFICLTDEAAVALLMEPTQPGRTAP